ncbi:hypothetical protein SEA_MARIOKART_53 [Gordonia phage Mariokart]|nr:hypothetical protein SEA_MARIOKART_53 [Gordonia phage Mariokart]
MSLTFPPEHPVLELTSAVSQATSRFGPDDAVTARSTGSTHSAYFDTGSTDATARLGDLRETGYRKTPRTLRPTRVSVHWSDGRVREVVIYGRGVLRSGETGKVELSAHYLPANRLHEWSDERPLAELPEAVLGAVNAYAEVAGQAVIA